MKWWCFLVAVLWSALLPAVAATHVAVLETVSENDVIGRSEKMFLTDKLRERAKVVLSENADYVIMTRENIIAMLPPGKALEECEGSCLAETGKNISADYVAQARVGKFGSQYTLTMELYETIGSNLVGSFTSRKPDADGLLDEIEKKADDIFKLIIKTKDVVPVAEDEAISNIAMGSIGNRLSMVRIESNPKGTNLSVDGSVNGQCNKTPCAATLPIGKHRFVFTLDGYIDKDTVVDITQYQQIVKVDLSNHGLLYLKPVFVDKMGSIDSSEIKIDGKLTHGIKHRLSAGIHKVEISHRCYEKVSFDVNMKNGAKIKFTQDLQPIMGGLNLKVIGPSKEYNVDIYVNGTPKGKTPLENVAVPICATLAMGKKKNIIIPVKLEAGKTISYTHNHGSGYTDPRDGLSYKIIILGKRTWFAENLNYKSVDSWCYQNNPSLCQKYGRLYTWESAMKICPTGWHLPSVKEYERMFSQLNLEDVDLTAHALKTKSGWSENGNGIDSWSFGALPAGGGLYGTDPNNMGKEAYFWTSTDDYGEASALIMHYNDYAVHIDSFDKNNGFSVRCVMDEKPLQKHKRPREK